MQTFEKFEKKIFKTESGVELYNEYKNAEGTMVLNEGTEDEVLFVPIEQTGEFPLLSLCVEDFESVGYDITNLPIENVKKIVSKIGDYLCNDLWECVTSACNFYDVPKAE